jgi:hypothetical protein
MRLLYTIARQEVMHVRTPPLLHLRLCSTAIDTAAQIGMHASIGHVALQVMAAGYPFFCNNYFKESGDGRSDKWPAHKAGLEEEQERAAEAARRAGPTLACLAERVAVALEALFTEIRRMRMAMGVYDGSDSELHHPSPMQGED